MDFSIGKRQVIIGAPCFLHKCQSGNFQIAAGQKKAPHGIFPRMQLIVYNLLVDFQMKRAAVQQLFKSLFDVYFSFPEQLFHQAVRTGICPVGAYPLFIQKI